MHVYLQAITLHLMQRRLDAVEAQKVELSALRLKSVEMRPKDA